MDLREITPYITIAGFIAIPLSLLDLMVKDAHKEFLWNRMVYFSHLAKRPFTLSFYFLSVIISIIFTLAILSVSGIASATIDGGSQLIALKSAGPILFAITLKIILMDYLFAFKTHRIIDFMSVVSRTIAPRKAAFFVIFPLMIIFDVYITASITAGVLNWGEAFQSQHINERAEHLADAIDPPNPMQTESKGGNMLPAAELENSSDAEDLEHLELDSPLKLSDAAPTAPGPTLKDVMRDFFDSFNFVARDSVEKSFYALNGTLFMYALVLVSFISAGIVPHLDVTRISCNIFKIFAGIFTFTVGVICIARQISL